MGSVQYISFILFSIVGSIFFSIWVQFCSVHGFSFVQYMGSVMFSTWVPFVQYMSSVCSVHGFRLFSTWVPFVQYIGSLMFSTWVQLCSVHRLLCLVHEFRNWFSYIHRRQKNIDKISCLNVAYYLYNSWSQWDSSHSTAPEKDKTKHIYTPQIAEFNINKR
jgi:hypothetical protein